MANHSPLPPAPAWLPPPRGGLRDGALERPSIARRLPDEPQSSATGMKLSGISSPSRGWRQRPSASAPTTRPAALLPSAPTMPTTGCQCSTRPLRASAWRRSFSMPSRVSARAFSSGEKKRKLLRPVSLAWFFAASAFLSSSPKSRPSPGYTPMPIDAVRLSERPSIVNGRARIDSARCASVAASSDPLRPFHSSANSSLPRRASVSSRRSVAPRRSATARSSASPVAWPRESLTSLKRSRSR